MSLSPSGCIAQDEGTRVGRELLLNVPMFTQREYILSDLSGGAYMVPFAGLFGVPTGFDPATASDREVAVIAHELVHLVQRQVGRTELTAFRGTQYAEVEAYIIQYAIQYELGGANSPLAVEAQGQLRLYTGSVPQAYAALVARDARYADDKFYSVGTHGTGNWRDTLLELGFSVGTVQYIGSLP